MNLPEICSYTEEEMDEYCSPKKYVPSLENLETDENLLLTKEELEKKILVNGFENVMNEIKFKLKEKNIEFPYIRIYTSDIDKKIDNLLNFKVVTMNKKFLLKNIYFRINNFFKVYFCTFRTRYTYFISNKNDYENINILTDLFTEEIRVKNIHQMEKYSPYELWNDNNSNNIIFRKLFNKGIDITIKNIRESIREVINEPKTISITNYYSILKILQPKKVLDYYALWGDKLIAGLATESIIKYTGYYEGEVDYFSKILKNLPKKDVTMINNKFNNIHLYKYDLVLHIVHYLEFKKQYEIINYVITNIIYSMDNLLDGGFLLISINDVIKLDLKLTELTLLLIESMLPNLTYDGVIGCGEDQGFIYPIWIFRRKDMDKNLNINTRTKDGLINLKKFYQDFLTYNNTFHSEFSDTFNDILREALLTKPPMRIFGCVKNYDNITIKIDEKIFVIDELLEKINNMIMNIEKFNPLFIVNLINNINDEYNLYLNISEINITTMVKEIKNFLYDYKLSL